MSFERNSVNLSMSWGFSMCLCWGASWSIGYDLFSLYRFSFVRLSLMLLSLFSCVNYIHIVLILFQSITRTTIESITPLLIDITTRFPLLLYLLTGCWRRRWFLLHFINFERMKERLSLWCVQNIYWVTNLGKHLLYLCYLFACLRRWKSGGVLLKLLSVRVKWEKRFHRELGGCCQVGCKLPVLVLCCFSCLTRGSSSVRLMVESSWGTEFLWVKVMWLSFQGPKGSSKIDSILLIKLISFLIRFVIIGAALEVRTCLINIISWILHKTILIFNRDCFCYLWLSYLIIIWPDCLTS